MSEPDSTLFKFCTKCGCETERESSGGRCKPCRARYRKNTVEQRKAYQAEWNKQNEEHVKAYRQKYHAENRDRENQRSAAWKQKNPEKVIAYRRRVYLENPQEQRDKSAKWRRENPDLARKMWAEYYRANKDRKRVNSKLWFLRNKERVAKLRSAWVSSNKQKLYEYGVKYRSENRNKLNVHQQNRRAKLSTSGNLSKDLPERLFVLQHGRCACCGEPLGSDYHLDHIMPLSLGGTNTNDNIQLLRKQCNLRKRAKHPVEFMQSRGFLL